MPSTMSLPMCHDRVLNSDLVELGAALVKAASQSTRSCELTENQPLIRSLPPVALGCAAISPIGLHLESVVLLLGLTALCVPLSGVYCCVEKLTLLKISASSFVKIAQQPEHLQVPIHFSRVQ